MHSSCYSTISHKYILVAPESTAYSLTCLGRGHWRTTQATCFCIIFILLHKLKSLTSVNHFRKYSQSFSHSFSILSFFFFKFNFHFFISVYLLTACMMWVGIKTTCLISTLQCNHPKSSKCKQIKFMCMGRGGLIRSTESNKYL